MKYDIGSALVEADRKFFTDFCAKKSRAMTKVHNACMVGQQQILGPSLALQVSLQQAVEQAHLCTHKLRKAMGGLEQQIEQRTREAWKCKESCSEMEKEVERWKRQCRQLEEVAQASEQLLKVESRMLEKSQYELKNVQEENTTLREKLEQHERELHRWKEDCVFFAMKLMDWGPALLNWAPALHQELRRQKELPKQKKIAIESKQMTRNAAGIALQDKLVSKGPDGQHDHWKYKGNADSSYLCATKLWGSEKRKCILSCSTSSASSCMDFQSI